MKSVRLAIGVISTVLATACGTMQGRTDPHLRQALAPTGKLRVALFEGNAVHAVRDPSSGEIKGVSHDLGKILA